MSMKISLNFIIFVQISQIFFHLTNHLNFSSSNQIIRQNMDPNNNSGILIHDNFDEFDFSAVSSVGIDLKQILEKIKQLEAKLARNNEAGQFGCSSSSTLQIGLQLGKMENQMEVIKKELTGKNAVLERKIAENDSQMQEMKDEIGKLSQINVILNKTLTENGRTMEGMKKGMAEMLIEISELKAANKEGKTEFAGMKEENWKLKEEIRGLMNKQKAEKEAAQRVQTVLNESQLKIFNQIYNQNQRPDTVTIEHLVEMTGLNPRVIRAWFQNKQSKDKKRQLKHREKLQNQKKAEFDDF